MEIVQFTLLFALFALLFAIGLQLSGTVTDAKKSLEYVRSALEVLRDSSLTDLQKESAMRSASLQMLACFARIIFKSVLAVLLPTAICLVLLRFAVIEPDALVRNGSNLIVIAASTAVACITLLKWP